jgi:uncharacterized Zn finger protein
VSRENRATKARRLLCEGRVVVDRVQGRFVRAYVRGDSGSFYTVTHDAGHWYCECVNHSACSHIEALRLVVAIGRRVQL